MVTVIEEPEAFAPAYNPIWWLFDSDQKTQANFEYFLDIFITGVEFAGETPYLRLKTPGGGPQAGHGAAKLGIFNVADILQRQLTSDIGDSEYGFQQCSNSIIEYQVRYGEMYGPSSAVTEYISGTSIMFSAFNGSLGVLEWKDYIMGNYVSFDTATNTGVKLLSNQPPSGTIRALEDQWIYLMSGTSGAVKFANINIYAGTYNNKVFQGGYRVINHSYFNIATPANKMLRFPSGWNLMSIPQGSIYDYLGGAVDYIHIDNDNIKMWEIYFLDSNHNRLTESFWVMKDDMCSNYEEYRLHFKNKWGGFDSFTFTKASQTNVGITRNVYERPTGNFKSITSYTYNKTDRFQTNFYTGYKHTIRLNSDWITEDQSLWLEELLTSPEVYLYDSRMSLRTENIHGLVPVNIVDTNYTQRKHVTDRLFNISIEIQYTFRENRQGA